MAERMVMPCVPLRGLSVFPHTILHFDIGREKSVKALEAAMTADKQLFLTSQKDENILIPTPEDYYAVGTVVKIKQMLKIQGDAVRVLVEGQYRAVMSGIATEEPYIMAEITEAEIVPADPQEIDCLLYTSDAADDMQCVDLGGRRIIKKNFFKQKTAYEISECLVGSEMCIRDRMSIALTVLVRSISEPLLVLFGASSDTLPYALESVSYTHLTLPTICSV